MTGIEVPLSVSKPLYQRLEKAARLAQCDVQDVIVSALETALPLLPETLQLEDAAALARLALLDDETLQTLAETFLPQQQQRRTSRGNAECSCVGRSHHVEPALPLEMRE